MPLLIVPLLIVLDQTLKTWAVAHLVPGVSQKLLPGIDLTLVYNSGAAFGLFPGMAGWLSWVSLAVGFGLLFYLGTHKLPRLSQLAFSLIAAGALGNAIDRIGRGSVVDSLDLGTNIAVIRNFAVFNLADSSVVVGVLLLILFPGRRKRWL